MPACSYCGQVVDKTEREHIFPRSLYPRSKQTSRVQRLTIKACRKCNASWSDDEAHFRNVLVMCGGNPNPPRRELWDGPISRSFDEADAQKRIHDLVKLMRPVRVEGIERHMIYPAEDERVLRVVRKIIRGLAHHHALLPYVPDDKVWADVLRYQIPGPVLNGMAYHHREPDVAEYWYEPDAYPEIHSAWLVRFFEMPSFVGIIYP